MNNVDSELEAYQPNQWKINSHINFVSKFAKQICVEVK